MPRPKLVCRQALNASAGEIRQKIVGDGRHVHTFQNGAVVLSDHGHVIGVLAPKAFADEGSPDKVYWEGSKRKRTSVKLPSHKGRPALQLEWRTCSGPYWVPERACRPTALDKAREALLDTAVRYARCEPVRTLDLINAANRYAAATKKAADKKRAA